MSIASSQPNPLSLDEWKRVKSSMLTRARMRLRLQWVWVYGRAIMLGGGLLLVAGPLIEPWLPWAVLQLRHALGFTADPKVLESLLRSGLIVNCLVQVGLAVVAGRQLLRWPVLEQRLYRHDMQPQGWAQLERQMIDQSLTTPLKKPSTSAERLRSGNRIRQPRSQGQILVIAPSKKRPEPAPATFSKNSGVRRL